MYTQIRCNLWLGSGNDPESTSLYEFSLQQHNSSKPQGSVVAFCVANVCHWCKSTSNQRLGILQSPI